jgi:hypothetical protein
VTVSNNIAVFKLNNGSYNSVYDPGNCAHGNVDGQYVGRGRMEHSQPAFNDNAAAPDPPAAQKLAWLSNVYFSWSKVKVDPPRWQIDGQDLTGTFVSP